jgi:hypothetical protein
MQLEVKKPYLLFAKYVSAFSAMVLSSKKKDKPLSTVRTL